MYGLLDSGAIPNFSSETLAENLRLNLDALKRRVVVADGSTGDCSVILEEVPLSFGNIVVRLKFVGIKSLP